MSVSDTRVLVIASDTVGPRMAGSGIRYWNFARVLGVRQPVTLATPLAVEIEPPPGVQIIAYGDDEVDADEQGRRLARLVETHDIIIAQHLPYLHLDVETLSAKYLVLDLYAPWILEKLEYARVDPERGEAHRQDDVEILNRLLELGDFFLCASERQRDFWLGALAAAGRLDLDHVQADPELRRLIDVVSFGLPSERPIPSGEGPRERFPQIPERSPILLWNGGVWNWLDPLTAIRATGLLAERDVDVRLVFMGVRSPGAQVAEMEVVDDARSLAKELGLLDSRVFFNDWVPYDERQTWLLASAATLSLHHRTIESRYAFRTRVLDNLWCGVPIVATEGDVLADLIQDVGIGTTVPPGDAVAVANAIEQIIDRDVQRDLRARIATVARDYTWERVSEPLIAFCKVPWRLGTGRGRSAEAEYIHKLERLYTETATYARELERAVAEKNAALEASNRDAPPWGERLRRWRRRA